MLLPMPILFITPSISTVEDLSTILLPKINTQFNPCPETSSRTGESSANCIKGNMAGINKLINK